jgi:DNA-binding transcriptional MerR regulator
MKIGEIAQRTRIPASCIRYYERKGLLPPARRLSNGYRDYPPEVFETLLLIKAAQSRSFSLEELRSMLPGPGNHWPSRAAMLKALRSKQGQLSRQLALLKQSQAQLDWLCRVVARKPRAMPRTAHIRQVLAQLKSKGILQVPRAGKKKEPG